MALALGYFNGGAAAAPRIFGAENVRATRDQRREYEPRQRKRNPRSAHKKEAALSGSSAVLTGKC